MGNESKFTLWSFVTHAALMVKMVIFLLFISSIISWALIFQRAYLIRQMRHEMIKFERIFWSGVNLTSLFNRLSEKKINFLVCRIFFIKVFMNLAVYDGN